MNGRFVILTVLLAAGKGFVNVEEVASETGPTIDITVDRAQILTTGKQALSDFLFKLNVVKATANVEEAGRWFGELSTPSEKFLRLREIYMQNLSPRSIEMQGMMYLHEGRPAYRAFEESLEGVIEWKVQSMGRFAKQMESCWTATGHLKRLDVHA